MDTYAFECYALSTFVDSCARLFVCILSTFVDTYVFESYALSTIVDTCASECYCLSTFVDS